MDELIRAEGSCVVNLKARHQSPGISRRGGRKNAHVSANTVTWARSRINRTYGGIKPNPVMETVVNGKSKAEPSFTANPKRRKSFMDILRGVK